MFTVAKSSTPSVALGVGGIESSTLGPWRLVRQIGEGESSLVYLASPIDSKITATTDYVLKRIKPDFERDSRRILMFQREAYLGRNISHPHLTCVLSSHVDRPPHFVVFPFRAGSTVADVLCQSERLPAATALWIARQTAEGIDALHQQAWLHGDIKSQNVYVASNGHTTLCDLGFARPFSEVRSQHGVILGTPAYLAPEFYSDPSAISPAADVYSLGVLLFEMLTGSRPFVSASADELAAAHQVAAPPDIRRILPQVAPGIGRLLRRMLAKQPLRRPTGKELVDALIDLEIDEFASRA